MPAIEIPDPLPPAITLPREVIEFAISQHLEEFGASGPRRRPFRARRWQPAARHQDLWICVWPQGTWPAGDARGVASRYLDRGHGLDDHGVHAVPLGDLSPAASTSRVARALGRALPRRPASNVGHSSSENWSASTR